MPRPPTAIAATLSVAPPAPPEPVRIRTLVLLRWLAIGGQLATVSAAWAMGLRFALGPVLGLIAFAAAFNLALMLRPPSRMSARRVFAQLGFDLLQLSTMIALTGGLSNPFALMVLAPVIVAATALSGRQTAALGLATAAMFSLIAMVAMPLHNEAGMELRLPSVLALGHWTALLLGAGFFALYAHRVSAELSATETALFATQMALAREQRLQHLGGVVAAAAHEMGTPLATIKLIAAELSRDLADRPDVADDLQALRDSADRCAAILRGMGEAGKDDLLTRNAPLGTVLDEAAAPHRGRGMRIVIDAPPLAIRRDPALIHGLRNLIQNAVDFARAEVRIEAAHVAGRVRVTIRDDGPGFPPARLHRLGEPDSSSRRRAGYEGMGLGLFIAKTLLERGGATLAFENGGPGAVARVTWPEASIIADPRAALGPNPHFFL